MKKLKQKWGLTSNWQVLAIILVFSINGSFATWIAKPVTEFFGLSAETTKPAKVLVDFANKQNVDMIVLGTHGRSGLEHLLMGSVAEYVVRHADCPVVTVRQSKVSQKTGDD